DGFGRRVVWGSRRRVAWCAGERRPRTGRTGRRPDLRTGLVGSGDAEVLRRLVAYLRRDPVVHLPLPDRPDRVRCVPAAGPRDGGEAGRRGGGGGWTCDRAGAGHLPGARPGPPRRRRPPAGEIGRAHV